MPRKSGKVATAPTGAKQGVKKTDDHWDAFFETMVKLGGNMSRACEVQKITRECVYNRRAGDPVFEARFKEAKRLGVEAMEDEATRRAVEGVSRGIYYQGDLVATQQEYSDGLIQFLLKANAPEKFKDRTENVNTNVNASFGAQEHDLKGLNKDELRTFLALLKKAQGNTEDQS